LTLDIFEIATFFVACGLNATKRCWDRIYAEMSKDKPSLTLPSQFTGFFPEPMIDAPPPTAKSRRAPTTWHITC